MAHITSCKKELKTQKVEMETKGEMKWRARRVLKGKNLDVSLAMHTSEFCPLFDISANLIIFPEKKSENKRSKEPTHPPFPLPFTQRARALRLQVGKRKRSKRFARLEKEEGERRRKKKGGGGERNSVLIQVPSREAVQYCAS